ncbi:MAG TPA: 50S ribosomal protein L22 [Candidatus Paceibacterota bacterium]
MKALLNNFRQSPRKMRLVTGLLKGKNVAEALAIISLTPKAAAGPLEKLLKSAVSNAKSQGKDQKTLFIKTFKVDGGVIMKRMMPRARGSAYRINKRTSHVTLELGEKVADK